MPRLPSADDLGSRPVIQQQGVVSVGVSPIGSAVGSLGDRIADAGLKIQDREDKMNFAKARAKFTSDMINEEAKFDQDRDYKTYGNRYHESIKKIKSDSAGLIKNSYMRETFEIDADEEITRGHGRLAAKAWGMEKDHGLATLQETNALLRENALKGDSITAARSIQQVNESIDAAVTNSYLSESDAAKIKQSSAMDIAIAHAGMLQPNRMIHELNTNKLYDIIPADKKSAMIADAKSDVVAQGLQEVRFRNIQRQEMAIDAYNDIQAGKQLSEIPYLSSLDVGQQEGLRRVYADKYSDKHIKTDYNEYLNVVDIYTNPKRKAEAETFDITTVKNIEPSKVEKLIDLRSRFLNKDDTSKESKLLSDTKAADNAIFTVTGKKPGSADFGDDERKVADAFYRVMDREMNAWLDENPGAKSVPSDVRDGIIDRMTMSSKKEGALWGQNEFNPFKELIEEEGLTPATIDSIAEGLRASGTPVNSVEIWQLYQLRKQEIK